MQVVVIDDNPIDLERFSQALANQHDADVLALISLSDNVERIAKHGPEMVVLDDRLGPILAAEDSLKTIAQNFPGLPVVIMSGDVRPGRRADLIRRGALECVEKDEVDTATWELLVAMAAQTNAVLKRPIDPQ